MLNDFRTKIEIYLAIHDWFMIDNLIVLKMNEPNHFKLTRIDKIYDVLDESYVTFEFVFDQEFEICRRWQMKILSQHHMPRTRRCTELENNCQISNNTNANATDPKPKKPCVQTNDAMIIVWMVHESLVFLSKYCQLYVKLNVKPNLHRTFQSREMHTNCQHYVKLMPRWLTRKWR